MKNPEEIIGKLVKYMSRTLLIVDADEEWVYGYELGETDLGKYKRKYLKPIEDNEENNKSEDIKK